MTIAVGVTVAVGFGRFTGQETDLLDVAVHAVLQHLVEAGGFFFRLRDVRQLRFERDAELMAAVTGQADLLTIVGFEGDHVIFLSLVMVVSGG